MGTSAWLGCVLAASSLVGAQTLQGRTEPVELQPNLLVDAGDVLVFIDSDHDGLPDDYETANGLDPFDAGDSTLDTDGDGLNNLLEFTNGTDLNNADTDGDGVSDGSEVLQNSDPLDPASGGANVTLDGMDVTPDVSVLNRNPFLFSAAVKQLKVAGLLSDGRRSDLASAATGTSYSSSDSAVALVSADGLVTAQAPGTVAVTVTNGAFSEVVTVEVRDFIPVPKGFVAIPGFAHNVDESGGFAFVAAGSAGVQVVDATDPMAPVIAGSADTPGTARDIRVIGNLAYVADGASGLQILDVSKPRSPIVIGSADTVGNASDVAVAGGFAYVADGNAGLAVIDVRDPANPVPAAELDTPGNATGVAVDLRRGILAIADGSPGIQVVDVSVPTSPSILSSINSPGAASDLVMSGTQVILADGLSGVRRFDLSDPASPVDLGGNNPNTNVIDVAVSGPILLASENKFVNAVPAFNLAFSGPPIFVGSINFANFPGFLDYNGTGIDVDGRFLYQTVSRSINGGDTRLQIAQYLEFTDNGLVPPAVRIRAPAGVIEGSTVTVAVDATDDVAVQSVRLFVDGQESAVDNQFPFELEFVVPSGQGAVSVDASALDFGGNEGFAPTVTIPIVPDPPPSIAIVQPAPDAEAVQNTQLPVSVDAQDNGFVASVSYFVNGQLADSTDQPPFSATLMVPATGPMLIEAVAEDDIGQQATAARVLDVVADQPPSVIVVQPVDGGSAISGVPLFLEASATDDVGVDTVQFFEDDNGTLLDLTFPIPQEPFEGTFDVPPGTAGTTLAVVAEAIDTAGNAALSFANTVTVGASEPPVSQISEPTDGSSVIEGTTIEIMVIASDDFGIADIQFFVNDVLEHQGSRMFDYFVPIGEVALQIRAEVTDTSGQTTADEVTVFVEPQGPPLLQILEPAPGSIVVEEETLQLTAQADDDVGITQVDLYVNDQLTDSFSFGTVKTATAVHPFVVPIGETQIEVRWEAFDNAGNSGTVSEALFVIPDPLTTVRGRAVQDMEGVATPVPGAAVEITGGFVTTTDAGGEFEFVDTPTIFGDIQASILFEEAGQLPLFGVSEVVPPERGGVTALGDIFLFPGFANGNGGFETGDFTGYVISGNPSIRTELGPLMPTEGQFMAFMTTGSGAVNSDFSLIESEPFTIPVGVNAIEIDFNFLSNEYPAFVGSRFNDKLEVILIEGGASETTLLASVNSAAFVNAPSGTGFNGYTDWITISLDVSDAAGNGVPCNIQMQLRVEDVGDRAVDTGALIDNIRFK